MPTQCRPVSFGFQGCRGRKVMAAFDGGSITSNAGALLLRGTDRSIGLFDRVAACFTDRRDPRLTEHSVRTLVAQRITGIALGYEDLNDHDFLRHDPLLALLSGKLEGGRKGCAALAGKSTLNRLEHAPGDGRPERYHRIAHDPEALQALLTELFIESWPGRLPPSRLVLDIDATDDKVHGRQEGRSFHGYYGHHWPLYIFCGKHPLRRRFGRDRSARPHRPGCAAGGPGSASWCPTPPTPARNCWPGARTTAWTTSASPATLARRIAPELRGAAAARSASTRSSPTPPGPRSRSSPRPSRPARRHLASPPAVYERVYCPRGNAENASRSQRPVRRPDLPPASPPTSWLLFSAFASILMAALRRALSGTGLAPPPPARCA